MQYSSLPLRLASISFASLFAGACGVDDVAAPSHDEPMDDEPTLPSRVVPHDPFALDVPRAEPAPIDACIPPLTLTAAQYGSTGIDSFRDVAVTRDGSILIAGLDRGQPSLAGGVAHSRGVVLAYRDTDGFAPRAFLDTSGTDSFESIAIDAHSSRVWLAARTNAAVASFPSMGHDDFLIGDLLRPGSFRPLARGLDSTPERPRQISAHAGRIAVAGSQSRVVLDGGTWIDPFLATYLTTPTPAIAPQWVTSRRLAQTEVFSVVDVAEGAIVVGGQRSDDGEAPGMFLAAYGPDADFLWQQQLSTHAFDELVAVKQLPDRTVLWAGTTTDTLGDEAHGGSDFVIGRFDPATGASHWIAQLGSDADERVADIAVGTDGRIHVVGDVANADLTDRDVVLLTLDADGTLVGTQTWASDGIDTPSAIAVDACGTAVIVGTTAGDLGASSAGMRDGFLLVAQ